MPNWLTPEILDLLGQGLKFTLALTFVTTIFSVIIGFIVGSLRLSSQRWLSVPAAIFVETFRNIPALVLILFFAFALPNAIPPDQRRTLFFDNSLINSLSNISGLSIPWYAIAAIVALTLNTSAYIAELFRAGAGTIAQEHIQAAQTMGASLFTIFQVILAPGAIRAAYPAITSRLIHNLKNTALASVVAVPELFNSIQTSITRSFLAIEFLMLAALLYLLLAFCMSAGLRWLERFLYPGKRVRPDGRAA